MTFTTLQYDGVELQLAEYAHLISKNMNQIPLRDRFVLINEYGDCLVETASVTPEECKARHDALVAADIAKLSDVLKPKSGEPVTADEFIKNGALGLVKIRLEVVEGGEYYQNMMAGPPPTQ